MSASPNWATLPPLARNSSITLVFQSVMASTATRRSLAACVPFLRTDGGCILRQGPTHIVLRTASGPPAVEGRAMAAWEKGTLTRADELEALCEWNAQNSSSSSRHDGALLEAVKTHLKVARTAAQRPRWPLPSRAGSRLESARSSLDAAEANVLQTAPASYLLGQLPSLLNQVQRHLPQGDPRREDMERIARSLGVHGLESPSPTDVPDARLDLADSMRGRIVSAVRGASSVALREQNRVRSFRNVVVLATVAMTILALLVAVVGWRSKSALPLCFAPEAAGTTTVVCPTEQSGPVATPGVPAGEGAAAGVGTEAVQTSEADIDDLVDRTTNRSDIAIVELVGLTAAGIAAAGAIRGIRGSSEPFGVPLALALLKLPTGAVTAVLGLLLMRGGFIPGLSALDTSAQIIAWAIVFGYAQQLFTRLVDQQAHNVLDDVRGGDKKKMARTT